MISSRPAFGKVSPLLIAVIASLTLQCGGGDDGGGVTPPTEPTIALSSNTATFAVLSGGPPPAPQTITISNSGGGTLDGLETSISYTAGQAAGWLAAVLSATETPSTLILTATPGGLAPATYTANVAITSDAASNSPQTLAVTLTVGTGSGGPIIALSSATQTFTAPAGGANPAAQTVEITNGGSGTLDGLATTVDLHRRPAHRLAERCVELSGCSQHPDPYRDDREPSGRRLHGQRGSSVALGRD